jgi:hypothetical protein
MALHPDFPSDPFTILDPALRWFPADETLRETSFEKLMPPLVPMLRKEVKAWRESGYEGASPTTKSLLTWWFKEEHLLAGSLAAGLLTQGSVLQDFRYFFSQREALETILYLLDVVEDGFGTLYRVLSTEYANPNPMPPNPTPPNPTPPNPEFRAPRAVLKYIERLNLPSQPCLALHEPNSLRPAPADHGDGRDCGADLNVCRRDSP